MLFLSYLLLLSQLVQTVAVAVAVVVAAVAVTVAVAVAALNLVGSEHFPSWQFELTSSLGGTGSVLLLLIIISDIN